MYVYLYFCLSVSLSVTYSVCLSFLARLLCQCVCFHVFVCQSFCLSWFCLCVRVSVSVFWLVCNTAGLAAFIFLYTFCLCLPLCPFVSYDLFHLKVILGASWTDPARDDAGDLFILAAIWPMLVLQCFLLHLKVVKQKYGQYVGKFALLGVICDDDSKYSAACHGS